MAIRTPRPNANALARLVAPFSTRASNSNDGSFSGWASTGALDSWGTMIAPGAFEASLDEHRGAGTMPALLAQHDWADVAGRILTLEAREFEGASGLWLEAQFELETQLGRELNALIQPKPRPALNGLSVGFEPDWDAAEWIDDVLVFHAVKLWEVSVVTFPANEQARIENARGGLAIQTERDLELALRDAGRSRSEAKLTASRFKPVHAPRDAGMNAALINLRALKTEMGAAFSS